MSRKPMRRARSVTFTSKGDDVQIFDKNKPVISLIAHNHNEMTVKELQHALSKTSFATTHQLKKLRKPKLLELYQQHHHQQQQQTSRIKISRQTLDGYKRMLWIMSTELDVPLSKNETFEKVTNAELTLKLHKRFQEILA